GYSTKTRFPTNCPDFQYFEVGDIPNSIGEGPNSFVASRGPITHEFTPSELRARSDSRYLDQDSHEFTPTSSGPICIVRMKSRPYSQDFNRSPRFVVTQLNQCRNSIVDYIESSRFNKYDKS
ncbi:hypothetical protein DPMN_029186, partial [Dreissena polymorpha]